MLACGHRAARRGAQGPPELPVPQRLADVGDPDAGRRSTSATGRPARASSPSCDASRRGRRQPRPASATTSASRPTRARGPRLDARRGVPRGGPLPVRWHVLRRARRSAVPSDADVVIVNAALYGAHLSTRADAAARPRGGRVRRGTGARRPAAREASASSSAPRGSAASRTSPGTAGAQRTPPPSPRQLGHGRRPLGRPSSATGSLAVRRRGSTTRHGLVLDEAASGAERLVGGRSRRCRRGPARTCAAGRRAGPRWHLPRRPRPPARPRRRRPRLPRGHRAPGDARCARPSTSDRSSQPCGPRRRASCAQPRCRWGLEDHLGARPRAPRAPGAWPVPLRLSEPLAPLRAHPAPRAPRPRVRGRHGRRARRPRGGRGRTHPRPLHVAPRPRAGVGRSGPRRGRDPGPAARRGVAGRRSSASFADDEATSLFATMGFWQGVDIPGRSSLARRDRPAPLRPPGRPELQARRERAGDAAFSAVDLPRASMLLAQGAGRLIRTARGPRRGLRARHPARDRLRTARRCCGRLPPMRRTSAARGWPSPSCVRRPRA